MKDRFYAKQFGSTATKMPLVTYGLWGLRDCLVIGSSFILPDKMSQILQEEIDLDETSALQLSQLICPIAAQTVATPVQMLGLDYYNRPLSDHTFKSALVERLKFQYLNFSSILTARILRIAPAYGVGGVGNTYFREKWRKYLRENDFDSISFGTKMQQ